MDTLFLLARRSGNPEFIVAPASLRELADSNDMDSEEVVDWAHDLAAYAAPDEWREEWPSLRQSSVLADFTRSGDAVLICEAVRLGCSALLTCDYRLVRQKQRIKAVAGVDVLTPSDVPVSG
jgi:hypothetical protein